MYFQVSNFSFFFDSNENYMTLKISRITVDEQAVEFYR